VAHAEKRGKFWRVKYKKPDGSWGSASRDADGKRFTTERSAETYGADLEAAVRAKKFVDPRSGEITVASWSKTWLESIEVGPLSERDYRSRLKAVILPKWGTTAVRDITTVMYNVWIKEMRTSGRSANSIRGITSVFRTMLDDAVASKVIGENPAPPRKAARRGKFKGNQPDAEVVIASPRQVLLAARNAMELRGLTMYALVLTVAYAQMRIGEAAGLRRQDLQLVDKGEGARIMLAKQSQYVEGKPTLINPKYDSDRGLIIPPFLAELLGRLIASHSGEYVFTAPKGGRLLIGGDFYADTWRPIIDGRAAIPSSRGHKARPAIRPVAGIEGMVPHGCRHSGKVWLDEGNHPRIAVEERMGHTVPGVEGTYSHTTLGMELKIAAHLQELWEQSLRVVVDRREWGPVPEPDRRS
jgi:integrase